MTEKKGYLKNNEFRQSMKKRRIGFEMRFYHKNQLKLLNRESVLGFRGFPIQKTKKATQKRTKNQHKRQKLFLH